MQTSLTTPQPQTQKAVQVYQSGDVKGALRLVKGFKIGLSKGERGTLALGYECIVHPDFYQSLGKNLPQCIEEAKNLFIQKFIK